MFKRKWKQTKKKIYTQTQIHNSQAKCSTYAEVNIYLSRDSEIKSSKFMSCTSVEKCDGSPENNYNQKLKRG